MFGKSIASIAHALYYLSVTGLNKGPHVTRYYMYEHLSKFSEYRSKDFKVLSISHSEELARILGFSDQQITDVAYPEFNIFSLPFSVGEFDAVVSDQVLEHVEGDPQLAIDETFRVIKQGGIALHTTCFINPIHGAPKDYWRFTPEALRLLASKQSEVIDVGGWGNMDAVFFADRLGLRFAPIPHARWHPAHWIATRNVDTWPIVTWVLARKKKT